MSYENLTPTVDIFYNFQQQTQMKGFWYRAHSNVPLHTLPGKICWLGLDSGSLWQLWKHDRCSSLWVFKSMFLEGFCSAWCHYAACLNGFLAGGSPDWPSLLPAFFLGCSASKKTRDSFWGSAHVNQPFQSPYGRNHYIKNSAVAVIVGLLGHICPHLSPYILYEHFPLHLKAPRKCAQIWQAGMQPGKLLHIIDWTSSPSWIGFWKYNGCCWTTNTTKNNVFSFPTLALVQDI